MNLATGFPFTCTVLFFGIWSTSSNHVKIPERDFQYIVNSLQMKHKMTYDDARGCVLELEHFYTGIKNNVIDSVIDYPSSVITDAWETHIVYTSMYYNFSHSTFGRYIHYKPTKQDKGQLYVYHKLKTFGIDNMNETIWLMESPQLLAYLLSTTRWNTFFNQSSTSASFNGKVNNFLKKFVEEHNPTSHNYQVLDMGMGQGRNSIWLAQKGYKVTGFDTSIEGIEIAKDQAKQLNLTTLQTYVADDQNFDFGFEQWDLIVCMYFSIRNITSYLQKIEQSLKCKGLLIVEAFHWDGLYGENSLPMGVTYKTNTIPSLFPNLTTIRYEEPVDYSDFGKLLTKLIRYVGQKQHSSTCS